jgi:hypothetical protein
MVERLLLAAIADQCFKAQHQRHPRLWQLAVDVAVERGDELALLVVREFEGLERSQIAVERIRLNLFGQLGVGINALVDADLRDQQEIGQPFERQEEFRQPLGLLALLQHT